MSGFGCPSCIDAAFLPGSLCQQNSEALPEAGVVPGRHEAQGRWEHSLSCQTWPLHAPWALCSQHCQPRGAWLLQVYSGTLKRVTTPCCDTFQSRGSRWLPKVIVPVLLAQRSKKTEGKIRKKHPASSSLKLQTSLTYKCL